MKKQQAELNVLENYINDIPMIVNPCRLCINKKDETHSKKCVDCCFFYGSQFVVKKIEVEG